MFFSGIDIGKNTLVASLLEKITPYATELEIGIESTGHYWFSLYSFLIENLFVVHVINPSRWLA